MTTNLREALERLRAKSAPHDMEDALGRNVIVSKADLRLVIAALSHGEVEDEHKGSVAGTPDGVSSLPRREQAGSATPLEAWTRETLGRAIYLGLYEHQGGKWEANDSKEVWYACADRVLAATPQPAVSANVESPSLSEILSALKFDLHHQLTFGPQYNQAVKDSVEKLALLAAREVQGVRLYTRRTELGAGAHVIVEVETADHQSIEVIRDYADISDSTIDHWSRWPRPVRCAPDTSDKNPSKAAPETPTQDGSQTRPTSDGEARDGEAAERPNQEASVPPLQQGE